MLRTPTLAAAFVLLALAVLLAAWETPADVGGVFGTPVEGSVRVARSPLGIGAAAWLETFRGRTRPVASRYDGTAWSPAVFLDGADRDASGAAVAVSVHGDIQVVWIAHGSPMTVQAARYAEEGDGWDPPIQVDDEGDPSDVRSAGVAAGNGGVAMAIWAEGDVLRARQFSPAGGWGDIDALSTRALSEQDPVGSVAMDGSGHGVVVWSAFDGTNYRVKAAHWDGAWSEVRAIDTSPTFESRAPVVAMDGMGRAAAAWVHDAGAWEPRAAWFDGTDWEDAVNPAPPQGVILPEVSSPRVAAGGAGGLAAFEALPGPRVFVSNHTSDGSWSRLAGFPDGGASRQPTVALDLAGTGFVAYHSGGVVWASRYDGTTFGVPEQIGADLGGSGTFPRVATGPVGEGVLFYHRDDGASRWVTQTAFTGGPPEPPPDPPVVRKLKAKSASPGAKLSVIGRRLGREPGKVRFGALDAIVLKWKKGRVDAVVPEGTGEVDVTVELADGRTVTVPFTYAAPVLEKIAPKKPKPAGKKVKLKGRDFGIVERDGASGVLFGGTAIGFASPYLASWSTKTIKVVVPPGEGAVEVRVITSAGESAPLEYTYP